MEKSHRLSDLIDECRILSQQNIALNDRIKNLLRQNRELKYKVKVLENKRVFNLGGDY